MSSGELDIKIDLSAYNTTLGKLIRSVKDRRDLMTALAGSMLDAVGTTLNNRVARNGWAGVRLMRSGAAPGKSFRSPGDWPPVSALRLTITRPRSGQTSVMPVSTTKAAKSAIRHGRRTCILNSTKRQRQHPLCEKRNSNFVQSATVGAYTVNMPARPFLQLVQDDIDELENTANRYFARVID